MRIVSWNGPIGRKLGGLERYNILLSEKCQEREHHIVFMHDFPDIVPGYVDRLQSTHSKLFICGDSYNDPWTTFKEVAKYILSWKPDVVHTHFVNPIALPLLRLLGVPLIYQTYHTGIDHKIAFKTRLVRWIVQICARRIFAVSERVRRDEIGAGVRSRHIQTLPLGIPIKDIIDSASTFMEQAHSGFYDQTKTIIITVGRFYPVKGMLYVVEAALEVVKKRPDVIWWLVGKEGPDKEHAFSMVQEARLLERVLFLGERNDVPSLMCKAYTQVVGSIFEGLPLGVLEAAVFGIPTVGTRIGGMDEAIVDGVTGILVDRRDSQALAAATNWLLENPNKRELMGAAAKRHVAEKFDSEKQISKLLDFYEKDNKERFYGGE